MLALLADAVLGGGWLELLVIVLIIVVIIWFVRRF